MTPERFSIIGDEPARKKFRSLVYSLRRYSCLPSGGCVRGRTRNSRWQWLAGRLSFPLPSPEPHALHIKNFVWYHRWKLVLYYGLTLHERPWKSVTHSQRRGCSQACGYCLGPIFGGTSHRWGIRWVNGGALIWPLIASAGPLPTWQHVCGVLREVRPRRDSPGELAGPSCDSAISWDNWGDAELSCSLTPRGARPRLY